MQTNQANKGKEKVKTWDRMVVKLKDKFIPTDYMISVKENGKPVTEGIDDEGVH